VYVQQTVNEWMDLSDLGIRGSANPTSFNTIKNFSYSFLLGRIDQKKPAKPLSKPVFSFFSLLKFKVSPSLHSLLVCIDVVDVQ
jgi:hypothetical protein